MRINRYNEKEYAEYILENGFTGKYIKYELKIVGKYYKGLGLGKKEIEEKILEFCEKYIAGFDLVRYYKTIDSVINYVRKKDSKLIIIENVYIDKAEFKYIYNLNVSKNAKKFCFALLVRYRLNHLLFKFVKEKPLESKYFSGDLTKQRKVFKMAKTGLKLADMNVLIKELYDEGVISIAENGKLGLDFLSKIKCCYEYFYVHTSNLDYVGLYYEMFRGNKRYGICNDCKIIFYGNGYGKLCRKCYKKNDIKNSKFRKRKQLKNRKC